MNAELATAAQRCRLDPEKFASERDLAIELLECLGVDTTQPCDPHVGKFTSIADSDTAYVVRRALIVARVTR